MLRIASVPDNSELRTSSHLLCPRLAVPRFPSLGSTVWIEIDAIAHALRTPSQELVVPHLASGGKFLEPLGVAEFTDQIILLDLTDTGFECIYPGPAARNEENRETAQNQEWPCRAECHCHDSGTS